MIRTEGLGFSVGAFRLENATLEVADGEYFVLLGPPGSGKSVFLECLCGLNRAERGCVFIDGQDVTGLEPRKRDIGYVPQDYALFPHLSVERNIASGLRARGRSRDEIRRSTAAFADMLGIGHLLKRRIAGLSGGEKQRAALARALVIEPRVLLLDEPVSALDESTREKVCAELRQLQQRLGTTTIHVSHNLEEAFSVADRGAVLRAGRIQQIGTMPELLRRPGNEFVARFVRSENVFEGVGAGPGNGPGSTLVRVGRAEFLLGGWFEGRVKFVIRPENVRLRPAGAPPETAAGVAAIPAKLVHLEDRGAFMRARLSGPVDLVAHLPRAAARELGELAVGAALVALVSAGDVHVLPE